jgi:hypothetical protein
MTPYRWEPLGRENFWEILAGNEFSIRFGGFFNFYYDYKHLYAKCMYKCQIKRLYQYKNAKSKVSKMIASPNHFYSSIFSISPINSLVLVIV